MIKTDRYTRDLLKKLASKSNTSMKEYIELLIKFAYKHKLTTEELKRQEEQTRELIKRINQLDKRMIGFFKQSEKIIIQELELLRRNTTNSTNQDSYKLVKLVILLLYKNEILTTDFIQQTNEKVPEKYRTTQINKITVNTATTDIYTKLLVSYLCQMMDINVSDL